ncbi:MAG TPA: hypothetical protein VGL56_14755 [Fimbriimonadaceae bacterium]|jgi:hypothetical protein
MIIPLIAALSLAQSGNAQTVELYRGAKVGNLTPRYWEVEDTTLDSTAADLNQGWQTELLGGPGKTILIQFLGLNRILGPHKWIVSASIVFTISSGNNVALTNAGQVLEPWNQGPIKSLLDLNPSNAPEAGDAGTATWRHRRLGGPSWEHVGAVGEHDSTPIHGATSSQPDSEHLQIDGLGATVESEYEHPASNHGFVLQFAAPLILISSQSGEYRPKLVLKVEDIAPATGPNLTITYIERKPEYERYENEIGFTTQNQDGAPVPVLDHPQNALSKKWPTEGEDLIYVAHVKNVGDAPAQGFSATWMDNEKPETPVDSAQSLKPGEETTLGFHLPYKNTVSNHRLQPVALLIEPKGTDAGTGNKYLEINQSALNIGVYVEKSFYDTISGQENAYGSHSFEDWIQGQVWLMGHVYFPYSRFSFAPDGVAETLRIQRINVVPDGTLQGPKNLPNGKPDLNYDVELGFKATDAAGMNDIKNGDLALMKNLGFQLGMVDFSKACFPSGDPQLMALAGNGSAPTGTEDMYPDFMGGGDTRDDARLPPSIPLPYQPYVDEVIQQTDLRGTDLLSAANAAELVTDLGKRRGFQGEALYDTPPITALSVVDYNGQKIRGADLTFYQMVNGGFPATAKAIKAKSNDDGLVNLTKRDVLAGSGDKVATGHELIPNPFGRIDYRGLNDTFLVKVEVNGVTEWGSLKLWQLTDSYHRGQKAVIFLKMAVNMPTDPLDETTDLAQGKTFTSSAGDTPITLNAAATTETQLPTEQGSWIEIDLGRDRTVGEVQLITKSGSFWKNFELRTYQTGEKVAQSLPWAQELNWDWSLHNQNMTPGTAVMSIPYRGPSRRFRYLRIINKGQVDQAQLIGIKIVPIKAAATPAH